SWTSSSPRVMNSRYQRWLGIARFADPELPELLFSRLRKCLTLRPFTIRLCGSEGIRKSVFYPYLDLPLLRTRAGNPEKSNFQGRSSIYRVDPRNLRKPISIQ